MRFVSLGYVKSNGFHDPQSWLERIRPYGKVLEALARKHTVISIEQIDYEGIHQSNGVEYHFIQLRNRKWPSSFHKLVKGLNPDVVIVHGLDFPFQVVQLRKALGKKVIILAQSHADRIPPAWKRRLQKIADQRIDGYLFTSKEMAAPWIKNKVIANEFKIKEVMMGASIFTEMNRGAAAAVTKTKGQPVFLFVGRIDANKDPYTLIRAFSKFAQKKSSASLYLIIQNPEKKDEIQNLINENSNVFIIGKILHTEMQTWFNSADFIVSTSHAEAFGMAVSEAMSCGCIPIVTNIPSLRKLTGDGSCGIQFEPGNVDQLAASFEKACHLDIQAERKKVLEYYNNHLAADAIAVQIENAVGSLR